MLKNSKNKTTTLINLRTYDRRYVNADYVLIDRRTIYGNRHKIGTWSRKLGRRLTREDSVMLFREDFYKRIKEEPSFRVRIEKLRGKKIACWCTPLACHGDVYVEYFEGE